jgi:raffinose/stachyose/melibiose transport system permease protein
MEESRTVLAQAGSERKLSTVIGRMIQSGALLNFLYIPALLLFFVFIFYPFFKGIKISFTNWMGTIKATNGSGSTTIPGCLRIRKF